MTTTSTGARVVFKINNAPVFFANAVSYEVNYNLEPLHQLDNFEPAEYYETHYQVKFTVNMFRAPNKSATTQGFIPDFKNLIIRPELSATMLDKITLRPLFSASRLKCSSESFEVSARNLASTTLTFYGITLLNESN